MHDDLILKIANLMHEQAAAYSRLDAAAAQLSSALVRGVPETVESLAKAGEGELLKMRSRLLQITALLTAFAETRAQNAEKIQIGADARSNFETASKNLLEAAREYEKTSKRAKTLALAGASFATVSIQMCGVPPSTYRAPILRSFAETAR